MQFYYLGYSPVKSHGILVLSQEPEKWAISCTLTNLLKIIAWKFWKRISLFHNSL